MEFPRLTGQGDSVSILINLPTSPLDFAINEENATGGFAENDDKVDIQGFGWTYNRQNNLADKTYYDFSFFIDGATEKATLDSHFLCGNKVKKSSVIGYCYLILPT